MIRGQCYHIIYECNVIMWGKSGGLKVFCRYDHVDEYYKIKLKWFENCFPILGIEYQTVFRLFHVN